MSRIRGKDTKLEVLVRSELHRRGFRFQKHSKDLPGKPDIVFRGPRVAVFLDGDFWHGYRFPLWKSSLSPFWQNKIERTRDRDRRNFAKLRQAGWRVVRIWQHQVEKDLERVMGRIAETVGPIRRPSCVP